MKLAVCDLGGENEPTFSYCFRCFEEDEFEWKKLTSCLRMIGALFEAVSGKKSKFFSIMILKINCAVNFKDDFNILCNKKISS